MVYFPPSALMFERSFSSVLVSDIVPLHSMRALGIFCISLHGIWCSIFRNTLFCPLSVVDGLQNLFEVGKNKMLITEGSGCCRQMYKPLKCYHSVIIVAENKAMHLYFRRLEIVVLNF